MEENVSKVKIENLPLSQNKGLQVELIPMPSGENPWRTRGDYEKEQRRDTIRFWVTIVSLIVSILSVVATAVIAITTKREHKLTPHSRRI